MFIIRSIGRLGWPQHRKGKRLLQ